MQTSTIKLAQRQIKSFFKPAPKSVSKSCVLLNKDPFNTGNEGKDRSNISKKAASMEKHRNVKKLREDLVDSKLTHGNRDLTLYTVSKDPKVTSILILPGNQNLHFLLRLLSFMILIKRNI